MYKIISDFIEIGIGFKHIISEKELSDLEKFSKYSPLKIDQDDNRFHPADIDYTAICLGSDGQIVNISDVVYFGSGKGVFFPKKTSEWRNRSGDNSLYATSWRFNTPADDIERSSRDNENFFWWPKKTKNEIVSIKLFLDICEKGRFIDASPKLFDKNHKFYIKIYQENLKPKQIKKFDLIDDYSGFDTLELGGFSKINGIWFWETTGTKLNGGISTLIKKYAKRF